MNADCNDSGGDPLFFSAEGRAQATEQALRSLLRSFADQPRESGMSLGQLPIPSGYRKRHTKSRYPGQVERAAEL